MEKESVINKIRKLLRLQFNAEKIGSTGEAYQAAKMVKKLLMEHNLSMGDIGSDEDKRPEMKESDDMTVTDQYGNNWKRPLLHVIATNHLCKVFTRTYNNKMFVIGAEENVIVVKEFYEYLLKVFRRLVIERFNESASQYMRMGIRYSEAEKKKFFRSYLEGVPYGLQENYDSMKPTSEETALVVCHNSMIDDYLKSASYNMKKTDTRRPRTRHVLGEAFDQGMEDGRKVNLNKQLNSHATRQQEIEFKD